MPFTDYYPRPDLYQANYGQPVPALPSAPAFDLRAALYTGQWNDITPFIYQRDTVHIQRGRQNEASTMQPSTATFTLNNRDGRFTTRNPAGAYFPNLVQNTPVRLSMPAGAAGLSNYLRFETDSNSYALSTGGTAITGSIDMRLDLNLTGWQALGSVTNSLLGVVPTGSAIGTLASKWASAGNQRSWIWFLNDDGTMTFDWSPDGTSGSSLLLTSTVPIPQQPGRFVLRVTMALGGTSVVTFYTAAAGNADTGPFTQLGVPLTTVATGIFNSTASVLIGADPSFGAAGKGGFFGSVYEYELRNGVAGTVTAHPVFSSQLAGATSFTDAQSNSWVILGTAEISDRIYRYHGELNAVPKAADTSGKDVYSQAVAQGVTRRLQNSNTPLQSAMRRAYTRLPASLNLAAYWPCEDGASAKSIGSALGGAPMQILGTPTLASNTAFACSGPLPVMSGSSSFYGTVSAPAGVTFTDAVVRALVSVPSGGDANNADWLQAIYAGGTSGITYCNLVYTTGGFLNMSAFNAAGTLIHSTGNVSFGVNGQNLRVSMSLKQNGGNVDMETEVLPVGAAFSSLFTASAVAAGTIGQVTKVQVGSLSVSAFGHVSVQGTWDNVTDLAGALNAWNGEPAATRVARLCSEEGIAFRIVGSQNASMPMNNQPVDTLYSILQQCENTDLGMLFEPRQCLGIGYRTRSSMYHQTPVTTASYTAAAIFQGFSASGDTQLVVNDVTATAPSGATARQFLATGPMSVQSPPNGIGRVDTQISPNPSPDTLVSQAAGWVLNVRSVDDERYPAVPLVLNRTETPVAVAALDVGDYLQITGTPAWLPPPPVRQLCAGFAETLFPLPYWHLEVNGIPELPYETAQAGTGAADSAHADTAGSQLTAAITSSATSFQVTTTLGPVWTQAGANFPFDIVIDREQMTVSAITGAASPQTFTVTRSVNGVVAAHLINAPVSLYRKPIAAL